MLKRKKDNSACPVCTFGLDGSIIRQYIVSFLARITDFFLHYRLPWLERFLPNDNFPWIPILERVVCSILSFFLLGYCVGPFLEPPGDPLDHLRNTYSTCGKTTDELRQTNKGLWQYSMAGNILCHEPYSVAPRDVLHRIDIANGAFWATSASILFVVGVRAGLPAGWAFLSVCLAFLFMGTNRFSYFSYYSFAPSLSSLWVFWLWIAAFFFKKERRYLLPGILTAGLSLCILSVNHIQEAIFLSLICGIWLFLYLLRTIIFSVHVIVDFGDMVDGGCF